MILETSKLILRPWEISDAAALYKYASDRDVALNTGWPPHSNEEQSREIIKTALSRPEVYAVVLKSGNEPVGSIGLHFGADSMSEKDDEPEIGYWLGKPFWGNGYIPEAVDFLINRAFTQLNAAAVWCGYYVGNERSKRVNEKCGFKYVCTDPEGDTLLGYTLPEVRTRITKEEYFDR